MPHEHPLADLHSGRLEAAKANNPQRDEFFARSEAAARQTAAENFRQDLTATLEAVLRRARAKPHDVVRQLVRRPGVEAALASMAREAPGEFEELCRQLNQAGVARADLGRLRTALRRPFTAGNPRFPGRRSRQAPPGAFEGWEGLVLAAAQALREQPEQGPPDDGSTPEAWQEDTDPPRLGDTWPPVGWRGDECPATLNAPDVRAWAQRAGQDLADLQDLRRYLTNGKLRDSCQRALDKGLETTIHNARLVEGHLISRRQNTPPAEHPALDDALRAVGELLQGCGVPAHVPAGGDVAGNASGEITPKEYVWNWRELLDAIKLKNDEEHRERVRRAHEHFPGPIDMPGQGGQPRADKRKLVEWWNSLESRWLTQGEGRNTQATLADQYPHGRDGVVMPEISGHIQQRRSDHNRPRR
jgi:hypothetical protein